MFAENTTDKESIVVVGDKGNLESLIPSLVLRHGSRADWGQREVWGSPASSGRGIANRHVWDSSIKYTGQHYGASYLEHVRFAKAIREGLPAEIGLEEGMRCVAVGVAAHRSIDTGLPVLLSDVSPPPTF